MNLRAWSSTLISKRTFYRASPPSLAPNPGGSPAARSGPWRGVLARVSQQAAFVCGRARSRARPDATSEC